MHLTLHMSWLAVDASTPTGETVRISSGTHEVERIKNPIVPDGEPWIVLKGTKIGASETFWRQWTQDEWGDFQVGLST